MDKITQRQVIGEFYKSLEESPGAGWINSISNYFTSDQKSEEYAWLGMTPALREWIGGRRAKGFRENAIEIRNKHFEATLEILIQDLRRDKTSQVMTRVREMALRTNSHWASLLSTLIANAESTACYDGKRFFATDHSEGKSGIQSNSIAVEIANLPVAVHGTSTAPAVAEMQLAIALAIQAMAGFKDDQGEPMNENATGFLVMVPMSLYNPALQAVTTPAQVAETQTALQALQREFTIGVVPNVRLSWMDKFTVFRTDSAVKSLIRQEETAVQLLTKWEDSEFAFDNKAVQVGVDTWRNVGYGYWQDACLVTLI